MLLMKVIVFKCGHLKTEVMRRKNKVQWKGATGGFKKPRRLKLILDTLNKVFKCPVSTCEHDGFLSKRGCCKHVFNIHGWYYYIFK